MILIYIKHINKGRIMKKLVMMSMFFYVSLLGIGVHNIVDTEDADRRTKNNKKELMHNVSKQYAQISNAQKKLQTSKRADISKQLEVIEQYQRAMDYQQINLDKLRKALQ